jgi:adenylosuccinate synthase
MMKADVLSIFEKIKVCTHYIVDGKKIDYLPYDIESVPVKPVYEELPGWNCDITQLTSMKEAPKALKDYIAYLEEHLEVPITVVSVGPDRAQTLDYKNRN